MGMQRDNHLLLLTSTFFCSAQTGNINTIAGNGTSGYGGDGSVATAARLQHPSGVAFDYSGNIYIADDSNHCVRKINSAGIITTIAGTGTGSYSGDGSAATLAGLHSPTGIATDRSGNLYIADRLNNRVRKVTPGGTITTFAGTGSAGYGGDGSAATAALLNGPTGVVVDDAGNIYIADNGNNRVRKVTTAGVISTFAGTGVAGYTGDFGVATGARFNQPAGVATDASGNIYIADGGNNCVRKVNNSGIVVTIAGNGSAGFSGDGGAATAAQLQAITGVGVDGIGDVYVADAGNNRIRKIDTTGVITTLAGTGTAGYGGDGSAATAAVLNLPAGVGVDGTGNVFIADFNNNRVRRVLLNRAPVFNYGISGSLVVCQNSTGGSFDSLMAVTDADAGQTDTWNAITAPAHGTVGGSGAHTSTTGGSITPTGMSYTPVSGYSGGDTFKVRVTDGYSVDTMSVFVTVTPLPTGGYITGADSVCPGGHDTLLDVAATPGGTWSHTDTFIVLGSAPGTFTGIYPGTESIVYTVTTMCGTASATLRVTVNPAPISGSIVGLDSECIGSSITLTNPTATPYGAWTTTDTTIAVVRASGSDTGYVTGVAGGTVTIYYNAYTHCGSAPAYHVVAVSPNAGTITGADSVCERATIALSESVVGGTWSVSGGGIATVSGLGVVTGLATGRATITYSVTSTRCGTGHAVFPVFVKALPYVAMVAGTPTVCTGGTTTLSDSTTGGTWTTSNFLATVTGGVVHGLMTGADTVTYAYTNTCGTAAASRVVTILSTPMVSAIGGVSSVCPGTPVALTDSASGGTWSSATHSVATIDATTGMVYGVAAGADSITYTLSNICGSASVKRLITVNALPVAGVITGASNVCPGAEVVLTDTAHGGGGTWSAALGRLVCSGDTVHGVTPGTDTVIYAVSNVCGTASARFPVVVYPFPSAGAIVGASVICPGSSVTFAETVAGGSWFVTNSNATISAGTVTGVSLGADTILYAVNTICGADTARMAVSINPNLMPSVTEIVSPDSNVCTGNTVTFTAMPVNGGASPYIAWFRNGVDVGTGLSYTYLPGSGDHIHCALVSSAACAMADTVYSRTIMMTAIPNVTPEVFISPITGDTVVQTGTMITLTASTTYCGPSPVYQWYKNEGPVAGATTASYTWTVTGNDTVWCIVSCNVACATSPYNHTNEVIVHARNLGLENEQAGGNNYLLYPNPGTGILWLRNKSGNAVAGIGSYEITDMVGKGVATGALTLKSGTSDQPIDVTHLAGGTYVLRVISGGVVEYMHFVVVKGE